MALTKLIALRNFSLGIAAERHNWSGPDPKYPRTVPIGYTFNIGETEVEQRDAAWLIYCGAAGDGNCEARIKAVAEEIAAMNHPAVKRTMEAMEYGILERLQQANQARAETHETASELEKTKQHAQLTEHALEKAQIAAALTLIEAIENWNRLELPEIAPRTRAMIMDAVRIYTTKAEMRSIRKIAGEYKVTPQRVSQWFKTFTKATGFPVIIHKRHQKITDHVRTDRKGRKDEESERNS